MNNFKPIFSIDIEKKNLEKIQKKMKDLGIKEMTDKDFQDFLKEVEESEQ